MNYWQSGKKLKNGKYIIEGIIGIGSFGVTYRGKEESSGKLVAIKTPNNFIRMKQDFANHQNRFREEAFSLAKCNHPHAITVNDVFEEEEENLWCMVMEYIEGYNLGKYVREKGVLLEDDAIKYIRQVGEALSYFHEKEMYHLDVKPINIFLDSQESNATLVDFGFAREFVQDKTKIQTNATIDYYAPIEQYEKKTPRSFYTDIYSLAATLYYLLTGENPIPTEMRKYGVDLIPPKQHNSRISLHVNEAILRGMKLRPENRPESMLAWLELLIKDVSVMFYPNDFYNERKKPNTEKPSSNQNSGVFGWIRNLFPPNSEVKLNSEVGMDYGGLQDLLAKHEWKQADRETANLIFKLAKREKDGWLNKNSINRIPVIDIHTIDKLWEKYSEGHFGFSVQNRIYQSLGGTNIYNEETWEAVGSRLGWYVNNKWLLYKDLNFDGNNAPEGHLPVLVYGLRLISVRAFAFITLLSKVK